MLTAGVITLLFVCYLVWGSGMRAASAQRAFASELNSEWAHAALPGGPGGSKTSLAASQPALPERRKTSRAENRPQVALGGRRVDMQVRPVELGATPGAAPSLPPAPAEKVAPPIKEK